VIVHSNCIKIKAILAKGNLIGTVYKAGGDPGVQEADTEQAHVCGVLPYVPRQQSCLVDAVAEGGVELEVDCLGPDQQPQAPEALVGGPLRAHLLQDAGVDSEPLVDLGLERHGLCAEGHLVVDPEPCCSDGCIDVGH
jgi:hypothetical protein